MTGLMAAVVLGRLLQGLAASWPASFRRLAWTGVGADTGRVGSIPAGGGCERARMTGFMRMTIARTRT